MEETGHDALQAGNLYKSGKLSGDLFSARPSILKYPGYITDIRNRGYPGYLSGNFSATLRGTPHMPGNHCVWCYHVGWYASQPAK